MKRLAAALLLLSVIGCASSPRISDAQRSQLQQLESDVLVKKKAGKLTQEQAEIEYASGAAAIYPFTDSDYEYYAVRIDVARRVDRQEVTFDQGKFLVQMKEQEIAQRLAQERAARKERGAAMMAMGAAILGGAYAPPAQQYYAPLPSPPTVCSSYVNGRYISTRCW